MQLNLAIMSKRNREPSIGRLISILHRQARVYFHRKLEPYGLGHGQMPVLMHLFHNEGITQHEISDHFYLDKGSTSSLISSLEKNGFIQKKQDEEDKRVFKLYVTDKTKECMPEFRVIFQRWTNVLLAGFTEEEEEKAFELLNRMIDNTQNYMKGEEQE